MSLSPSVEEIRSLFQGLEVVRPTVTDEAATMLGPAGLLIEEVGIPREYSDWFSAVDPIDIERDVDRFEYTFGRERRAAEASVRLGVSSFGSHVFEPRTGNIVYVEPPGVTEPSGVSMLVNSSIENLLYFIGRFQRFFTARSESIARLKRDARRIDPIPLMDPEAIWAITIEEIEGGYFG